MPPSVISVPRCPLSARPAVPLPTAHARALAAEMCARGEPISPGLALTRRLPVPLSQVAAGIAGST